MGVATDFDPANMRIMTNTQTTQSEVSKIEEQIKLLQAKRALLLKQQPSQWLIRHTLPGETINARNFDKLVTLAHTLGCLRQREKSEGATGATKKQISKYLNDAIGLNIKDATLRSYLSRFKEEGRLAYDRQSNVWSIPPD